MDNATYVQTICLMGNDIYIYMVQFPGYDIHEAVLPCFGGYTVYLDSRLSSSGKERAYNHAVRHIVRRDFEKFNVSEIELQACG